MKILMTAILSAFLFSTAQAQELNYPEEDPSYAQHYYAQGVDKQVQMEGPLSRKVCFFSGYSYDLGAIEKFDRDPFVCATVDRRATWVKVNERYLRKMNREVR